MTLVTCLCGITGGLGIWGGDGLSQRFGGLAAGDGGVSLGGVGGGLKVTDFRAEEDEMWSQV